MQACRQASCLIFLRQQIIHSLACRFDMHTRLGRKGMPYCSDITHQQVDVMRCEARRGEAMRLSFQKQNVALEIHAFSFFVCRKGEETKSNNARSLTTVPPTEHWIRIDYATPCPAMPSRLSPIHTCLLMTSHHVQHTHMLHLHLSDPRDTGASVRPLDHVFRDDDVGGRLLVLVLVLTLSAPTPTPTPNELERSGYACACGCRLSSRGGGDTNGDFPALTSPASVVRLRGKFRGLRGLVGPPPPPLVARFGVGVGVGFGFGLDALDRLRRSSVSRMRASRASSSRSWEVRADCLAEMDWERLSREGEREKALSRVEAKERAIVLGLGQY